MFLKQFFTAIILLAFSCQLFNRAAIVTSYYTNKAAYEKNCENKAKPQLACHGKCQMMKQLKAEEKKDQQNPERRLDNKNEVVLSSKSFYPSLTKLTKLGSTYFDYYQPGKFSGIAQSVFHPPTV
ncbi:MAG: hypothetical protein ACK4S0_15685 [Sediminibacterium sp.]